MEKKNEFKINVGASSIILIIVVFALAIFSVLSIKASNSDLILAKKTRNSVEEYYKADSEAETLLLNIDQVLNNYYSDANDESLKIQLQQVLGKNGEVDAKTDKVGMITYHIPMNEYAVLEVILEYDLDSTSKHLYDIKKWGVNQSEIGDYMDNDFTFWDGTIDEE